MGGFLPRHIARAPFTLVCILAQVRSVFSNEVDDALACSKLTDSVSCGASSSPSCKWTNMGEIDACLSEGQAAGLQRPEAQDAVKCSMNKDATSCAASSSPSCKWHDVQGYGTCLSTAQADALQNPAVQVAMECATNRDAEKCCKSGSSCAWKAIGEYDACMAVSSAEFVPGDDGCEKMNASKAIVAIPSSVYLIMLGAAFGRFVF